MNSVLEEIFQTGHVKSADGESVKLHSGITAEQGYFLQEIISKIKPKVSLEVGLAYGISALFICEALQKNSPAHHIIIDPFQFNYWKGIGLENLKRAGYEEIIEFHKEYSHLALPQLESKQIKIDFAFIDGMHTFDHTLIDFFFVDKLLNIGGIVVIDDCSFPSIRKVCRFIVRNRSYSVFQCFPTREYQLSFQRKLLKYAAGISQPIRTILKPEFLLPDLDLGLIPKLRCIAFKKEAEDKRKWDFHREF
ncbi:class I SAM-dependent methyltransferase [Aerosakkonemataceae cyanobacterium BLCC-F50]|uniref:Class I SAM-dependent methyltransferase n=1 Tax=Floridaenema flaviceps BLCC-F50 TaxID=3153642 RepID=A0ABV4XU65_9CYAN